MKEIDVKTGEMTFGQRIELGQIFAGESSEVEKFEKTFLCLHNFKPRWYNRKKLMGYFTRIVEGIVFWSEQEATLLKYEPTPEEVRAGVTQYTSKIGELGTIKALAKTYGQNPDDILLWKYGKVFGILYTDLEEHKYQMRLNKVIEAKYKS